MAVPEAGPPIRLVGDQPDPTAIAVGGGFVYVVCVSDDPKIVRVPVGGGTPTVVVQRTVFLTEVAADDRYVYWGDGKRLLRYAHTGGPIERFAKWTGPTHSLSLTGGSAYSLTEKDLLLVSTVSRTVKRIALRGDNPDSVVADSDGAFVLDGGAYTGRGWIQGKLTLVGPAPRTLVDSLRNATSVTGDDMYAYWVTRGRPGAAMRMRKEGGHVETVATEQLGVEEVAVEDAYVHWISAGSRTLMRVAKGCAHSATVHEQTITAQARAQAAKVDRVPPSAPSRRKP